jgi:hypothetical protein
MIYARVTVAGVTINHIVPRALSSAQITNTAIPGEQFLQCDVGVVFALLHSSESSVILDPHNPALHTLFGAILCAVVTSHPDAIFFPAVLANVNCQSLFRLATNQFSFSRGSLLCLDPRITFCLFSSLSFSLLLSISSA